MRKSLLIPTIILIVAAVFWGCGGKIPGLGSGEFSVESSYIQESGDHISINAEYPVLKGFHEADQLNSLIKDKVETAAEEVRSAASEMEGREGFSASLNSSYQYFCNDDIASLWISFDNYTGGAHGLYWLDSYTLNTCTGTVYTFPELFRDEKAGVDYVTGRIIKDIEKPQDGYFETAADTVSGYEGNFNFLINGDDIVVYFPLYDIAPYVAGIQHFDFSSEELEGLLKPEIANAIMGQESLPIPFLAQEPAAD